MSNSDPKCCVCGELLNLGDAFEFVGGVYDDDDNLYCNECLQKKRDNATSAEIQDLRNDNNRMRGQITEALAILLHGSDYDKVHLEAILENAIDKAKEPK